MPAYINWKETDTNDKHAIWWSGNGVLETVFEWVLRHDVEAFLPIHYIDDLIYVWEVFYLGTGLSLYHDFQSPQDQIDVIEHFRLAIGRLYVSIRDADAKGYETILSPRILPDLKQLLNELKYQQALLRSQKRSGKWSSFHFSVKDRKIERWAKSSRTFQFRPGLEWTYRPTLRESLRNWIPSLLGNKVSKCDENPLLKRLVEYVLNRNQSFRLPISTVYEMKEHEIVVRFNIHRRYSAEYQSIRYMLESMRELHRTENEVIGNGEQPAVIQKHELTELERLVTLLEQRQFELRIENISGKWKPASEPYEIPTSKKLETKSIDKYRRH